MELDSDCFLALLVSPKQPHTVRIFGEYLIQSSDMATSMAALHRIEEVNENKELIHQAYDALNRGAMDEFASLLSDDFHEITRKGTTRNKNECLAGLVEVKKAMPDVRYDIQDIIAEGDRVAVVENYSGTMKGPMRGSKPTGKSMSVIAVDVYEIKNGKLVEVRSVFDMASLTKQLGIKE